MNATRAEISESHLPAAVGERYSDVRRQTDRLVEGLSADDQMVQSTSEASPTKWHLAHTSWFFETFILIPHGAGYKPFDPRFTFLFNSYYKQLDGHPQRSIRGTFSRPTLDEVQRYRAHVDAAIVEFVSRSADPRVWELLELGLNHEQQHQELIVTDIKHAFWTNPLRPSYRETASPKSHAPPALSWVGFDEGVYEIGHAGRGFAFDNERPRHRVYQQGFRLGSRLVTNAEYLDFMANGGYRRPELWLSDGWDQLCANGWRSPLYWEDRDGEWWTFTCSGMKLLDLSEPLCHVSHYEADAFARWAGARLPSEAEWEIAAAEVTPTGTLLESERFHPATAPAGPGLQQMFGDVWEWTSSPYVAYPGYRAPEGVLGEYNGKFMCNQMVLRGGSCATPASHIRASYRNFFPPHARWQFSGIRLANDRA